MVGITLGKRRCFKQLSLPYDLRMDRRDPETALGKRSCLIENRRAAGGKLFKIDRALDKDTVL